MTGSTCMLSCFSFALLLGLPTHNALCLLLVACVPWFVAFAVSCSSRFLTHVRKVAHARARSQAVSSSLNPSFHTPRADVQTQVACTPGLHVLDHQPHPRQRANSLPGDEDAQLRTSASLRLTKHGLCIHMPACSVSCQPGYRSIPVCEVGTRTVLGRGIEHTHTPPLTHHARVLGSHTLFSTVYVLLEHLSQRA